MFGRKKPVAADRDALHAEGAGEQGVSARGPSDRSSVTDPAEHFTELGFGHLDLGSLVIGVPSGRDLNVALDQAGQPEFHVVTQVSRVIPRAFAAPKSPGQWRTMVTEMRDQLEQQGADASIVDGPWGRELVAEMPGAVFRAIGVDGHRWTAEVRIMSTPELAEQAMEEGREVFSHLLINRGEGPMPVREQLALTIPDEIQQALVQAQSQLAAQQQAQAYQQQMAAGAAGQSAPAAQAPQPAAQSSGPNPANPAAEPVAQHPAPRRESSAMDRLRDGDEI